MTTLGRERQMSRSSKEPVMLTVDIERASDVAIVRCAGRIVRGAEVSILRNAVVSEKDARTIVLDLSELEFVDARRSLPIAWRFARCRWWKPRPACAA